MRISDWSSDVCSSDLYWGKYRAEEINDEEIADVNNQLVASVGTCSVMGTASTMACIAEALGMTVPGGATPPAVTADRMRIAELTGAQGVKMAQTEVGRAACRGRVWQYV